MLRQFWQDLDSIKQRDPAAKSRLEILLAYPGVHAILLHRVAYQFWHWKLTLPARLLAGFSRWITGIEIHPAAKIGQRLFIDHGLGVVIGETAEIGDDVTLFHNVTLGGKSRASDSPKGRRHPVLCDGVMVGAGAQLLGGITIGKNVKIGANAVVTNDVKENTTVIGIPARPVEKNHKQT